MLLVLLLVPFSQKILSVLFVLFLKIVKYYSSCFVLPFLKFCNLIIEFIIWPLNLPRNLRIYCKIKCKNRTIMLQSNKINYTKFIILGSFYNQNIILYYILISITIGAPLQYHANFQDKTASILKDSHSWALVSLSHSST